MDAYRGAIESGDPALAAPTWYNLGNALYRQQRFQESLEAYKEALRIDSEEIDFKHNLELALEQLQQQDSQSEDGEEGDQNEDQESQGGEENPEPQDPNEDPSRGPPQEESPEEDQPEPDQQPEPEPGEMTRDEAERLLQGVQEDPDEINRRQAPLRGRRPSKPW